MMKLLAFLGLITVLAGAALLTIYFAFPETWNTMFNISKDKDDTPKDTNPSQEPEDIQGPVDISENRIKYNFFETCTYQNNVF